MINLDDTIVAISTPIGEGAIGIVRLSGKDALNIASKIFVSPKGKDIKKVSSHTIHMVILLILKMVKRLMRF